MMRGVTFVTVKEEEDAFHRLEKVSLVYSDEVPFLRIGDGTGSSDDLGDLPELD